MTLSVRPYDAADAEALADLHAAAFDPPQLGLAYWRGPRGTTPNLCMVAARAGIIVGYCDGFLAGEGGDVNSIAVAPAHRGQGIGHAALSGFLRAAKGRGSSVIHLEVSTLNDAAIALYAAAGFEPVGTRRAYYADGSDAVVMACAL